MCGRYTVTALRDEIQERFDIPDEQVDLGFEEYKPSYNVAPTDKVPAVYVRDGERRLALMKWGLIPPWSHDPREGARFINARAESLDEKPAFKESLPHRRCLVIADGFYEFKAEGKTKRPVRYTLTRPGLFAFAGVYSLWKPRDADVFPPSCTIVTTEPNELVAQVHNRMPVILPRESESAWLDPARLSYENIKHMLVSPTAAAMKGYFVNPAVNSVKNNFRELIDPFDYGTTFG
jgi:putative SOS response-associated peptidase YedK